MSNQQSQTKARLQPIEPRLLVNRSEAARLLGISLATLNSLTMAGTIPSVLVGPRGRRYSVKALEEFIESQMTAKS